MLTYNDIIKASDKYEITTNMRGTGPNTIGIKLHSYTWSWFVFYTDPTENPDVFWRYNYSQRTGRKLKGWRLGVSATGRIKKHLKIK